MFETPICNKKCVQIQIWKSPCQKRVGERVWSKFFWVITLCCFAIVSCSCLTLCYFVLVFFSQRFPRLGNRELILVLFVMEPSTILTHKFLRVIFIERQEIYPPSILYKSIADRYRAISYPDGPISARYRFIKNAYWNQACSSSYLWSTFLGPMKLIPWTSLRYRSR